MLLEQLHVCFALFKLITVHRQLTLLYFLYCIDVCLTNQISIDTLNVRFFYFKRKGAGSSTFAGLLVGKRRSFQTSFANGKHDSVNRFCRVITFYL